MPIELLDFDSERPALIEPGLRFPSGDLPERLLMSYFASPLETLALKSGALRAAPLRTFGLGLPVWVLGAGEQALALAPGGIGAPVAAGLLEELIARGARKILVCGGAGSLDRALDPGDLLLPEEALRDEGLSHHYLPFPAPAKPSAKALDVLARTLADARAPHRLCRTWTTDALYRETPARIASRQAQGAVCVEMEAAALFAVAAFRGAECAQLLYAGDDLASGTWDPRDWDLNIPVQERMHALCLEALRRF
jgi:purine-nucleoside phosphorylase